METRRPLRIGFIFEGPTDQETIPVLVAKLLNRPVERIPFNKEAPGFDDFRRRRQGDNPNLNRAWGMLKSYTINEIIHPHNGGDDLSQGQARQTGEYPGFSPEPIEAACPSFARFAADIRVLATIP